MQHMPWLGLHLPYTVAETCLFDIVDLPHRLLIARLDSLLHVAGRRQTILDCKAAGRGLYPAGSRVL